MNYRAIFHPIQRVISKLRSRLSNAWEKQEVRIGIAGVVLAAVYFIFAGLLPDYYIFTHYTKGHKLVSLYSHLFRYCEFFGWITVLLLIPPVTFLASQKINTRAKRLFALIVLIVSPTVIVFADLASKNIAPHEIRADLIENDPQLKDHFIKDPPTDDQKQAYQSKMNLLLEDRANWSAARYLHYLTIFLQTLPLVAIGIVVIALLMSPPSQPPRQSSRL